jgi:hypothetical protein
MIYLPFTFFKTSNIMCSALKPLPLYVIMLVIFCSSCAKKQYVDTILYHAKIYTVDSNFSTVGAVAIKDGRFLECGTDSQILSQFDASEIIDANGRSVYPGFIDAHAHFLGYGRSLFEVNLYDCKTWDEAINRVLSFSKAHPDEKWIRGRGWDQNKFVNGEFPDNTKLNQLFADKPILLSRVDGHAAIANAKALQLAGVRPNQKIVGGEIITNGGVLTGLLIDNAVGLVSHIIDKPTNEDYKKWLMAAENNCFEAGLTTITDCGLMYYDIYAIDSMQKSGDLKMRIYVMISDDTANYNRFLSTGPYKTNRLYVKGVKAYADGALGSRGACLLAPYNDKKDWNGFLLNTYSHFDLLADKLNHTAFQLCTHAIGDSANRVILNIYAKYLQAGNHKRWRIEHAQVVNRNDIALFGKYSIIPSVQPTHATSDMYWAKDRLGNERVHYAYSYKKLLMQNGWLPLGTDFPVEDISPIKTFYAACIRKDTKGFPENGFEMENALSRKEALMGMTIWAAKANCWEQEIGSIEKGKLADFVILDTDIMQAADADLLKAKVFATYSGGKKVFGK